MKRSIPLVALVLATVVLVVQARIVIGGKTWDDTRYHTEVAPPRLAAADAVQARMIPVWWEGSGLGVPLIGEPSHGAAYPAMWLAASPHILDLIWILHLFWAALGVALWARRLNASELGAVVAGVLVATTGVMASAAIRGALPALAHLPWIALTASLLAGADSRRQRARAAIGLGVLIGAVGLAGQFAVLVHAVALACLLPWSRRKPPGESAGRTWRWLATAIAAGLAISAVQWVPAIHVIATTAGVDVHGMKLARLLELIVPGSFGSSEPDRAVTQLAGTTAWFPSLYVGAPLLALATMTRPARRIAGFAAAVSVVAFVVGRGGWPAWLGAPELHIAALTLIAAAHAGTGVDAVLVGERRALLAIAAAAAATAIALGGLGALRTQVESSSALDGALLDGGLGFVCIVIALVVTWRAAAAPAGPADLRSLIIVVLLVAPSVGALRSNAPAVERAVVTEEPAWVRAARKTATDAGPVRVYRPPVMFDSTTPGASEKLDEAIATLVGTSAARWGIGSARSEDPARPTVHDRVWLAAASAGGQLLDRYSIALAILPGSTVEGRGLVEVSKRTNGTLAKYPASPPAAVVNEWIWVPDVDTAIARLFPPGAGRGLPAGLIVLHGTGSENQDEPSDAKACTIQRWQFGTIWLRCDPEQAAYAVVSSTAAEGWEVEVDQQPTPWVTADVMRRAVAVPAGAKSVAWFYTPPGWLVGLLLAGLGVVALLALWLVGRRS